MNLSRAAKKFRQSEPKRPKSPTAAPETKKKDGETPKPAEPAAAVDPPKPVVTEPVVLEVVEEAQPLPKPKRPRFVRPQTEKRQRVTLPPLVSSNRPAARVLTKKLFLLPKESGKVR